MEPEQPKIENQTSVKDEPQLESLVQQSSELAGSVIRQATPLPQASTSFAAKQFQRQDKLKQILSKRKKPTQSDATINLPFQIPTLGELPESSIMSFNQEHNLPVGDVSSVSSRLALTKAKFRKLNEERQLEYSKLIQDFQSNDFDMLFEQIKTYEKQQEKFRKKAFEQRQSDFNDETSGLVTLLRQQVEDLQQRFKELTAKVVQELQHTTTSTQKLFSWSFETTTSNLFDQNQKQMETASRIKDLEQAMDISVDTFDILTQYIIDLNTQIDFGKFDQKVTKLYQQILDYVSSEVKTLYEHIQSHNNTFKSFSQYLDQQLPEMIQQCTNFFSQQLQQQSTYIKMLEERLQQYDQRFSRVEQMANFSYFTSNVLIDQDHFLKQGMHESSSKQAVMLDLMQSTNNILQQHLPSEVKQQVDTQFKDSVLSLNLNKKTPINFANVGKIPEFLEGPSIDEREEANVRANDPNRSQYQQNINAFFERFPHETLYFMQNQNQDQDQNNQSTSKQDEQPQVPQQSESFKDILSKLNKVPPPSNEFSFSKPDFGMKFSAPTPPPPPTPPPQQQPNLQSFDIAKQLSNMPKPGVNTGVNRFGNAYSSQLDQAKLYATFNFKDKYTRNIHPQMFLVQFETVADQCMLTDQQRTAQFMFCLQHEYLDWYKARVASSNYNISWRELKQQFINTFQQDDDDVRDELYTMRQSYGETPLQYLNRLRQKIALSNLHDDDVKKQFAIGLLSQEAKEYIDYIKQFDKQGYKNASTTTLLQKVEKQARTKNFQLTINKTGSSTWKKFQDLKSKISTSSKNQTYSKTTYPKEKYPTKPQASKKVNFVDDTLVQEPLTIDPQNQIPTSTIQENQEAQNVDSQHQLESNDTQTRFTEEDLIEMFTNPALQFQMLNLYNETQEQNSSQANVMIAGPSIPTSAIENINNIQHQQQNTQINAGETEQVYFLNKKDQKNTTVYADKLMELAKKGKELQKMDIKQHRKLQYVHLPEQQLLVQAPQQFLQATQYLQECLNNNDNLLKNDITSKYLNKFVEQIAVRMAELKDTTINVSTSNLATQISQQVEQVNNVLDNNNLLIPIQPIDYLLYIDVHFQTKPVKALLDTGSTITVISEAFCNQNNIQIPNCQFSKAVTLADGSVSFMKEWKDTIIKLDQYVSMKCDILLSKNTSYDMLFGLNAFKTIGCTLTLDHLRYSFVNDKNQQKFGKVPLIKEKYD